VGCSCQTSEDDRNEYLESRYWLVEVLVEGSAPRHGRRSLAQRYLLQPRRQELKGTHRRQDWQKVLDPVACSKRLSLQSISICVVRCVPSRIRLLGLGGAALVANVVSSNGLHLKSFLYPPHVTLLL
jgi:hypothetical protein